jgi:hypothetical protein
MMPQAAVEARAVDAALTDYLRAQVTFSTRGARPRTQGRLRLSIRLQPPPCPDASRSL